MLIWRYHWQQLDYNPNERPRLPEYMAKSENAELSFAVRVLYLHSQEKTVDKV